MITMVVLVSLSISAFAEIEIQSINATRNLSDNCVIHNDQPYIRNVSADQFLNNQTSATLCANGVWAKNGIKRVWAEIIPPIRTSHMPEIFKSAFSEIQLQYTENNTYEASYPYFLFDGTYQIIYRIEDFNGYVSTPERSRIFVNNPLHQRAIIIVSESESESISYMQSGNDIYYALLRQGFNEDNICYLCPDRSVRGHDDFPTNKNVQDAITSWAGNQTKDVVLFFIGQGDSDLFHISPQETLAKNDLNDWINQLQDKIPGFITIIDDANHSQSYLQALKPTQNTQRILIASTGENQSAYFNPDNLSFTQVFGTFIYQQLSDVFSISDRIINALQTEQDPQIVYGNQYMNSYIIGDGYYMDKPVDIDSISQPITLSGVTSSTITACNISADTTIVKVLTMISPPGNPQKMIIPSLYQRPVIEMKKSDNSDCYSATYQDYLTIGTYELSVCAFDAMGNVSQALTTTIIQNIGPDVFEEDDSMEQANVIVVDAKNAQRHTFHKDSDEDWVKFHVIKGKKYKIQVSHLESKSEPVVDFLEPGVESTKTIWLFSLISDGTASFTWQITNEGIFYLKVRNNIPSVFGENTGYDLRVSTPSASIDLDFFYGRILDVAGSPIAGAIIKIGDENSTLSFSDGAYEFPDLSKNFTVTVSSPCHLTYTFSPQVPEYSNDIQLKSVGLDQLINLLQLLSGIDIDESQYMIKDYTENQIIGIEDGLYLMNTCF